MTVGVCYLCGERFDRPSWEAAWAAGNRCALTHHKPAAGRCDLCGQAFTAPLPEELAAAMREHRDVDHREVPWIARCADDGCSWEWLCQDREDHARRLWAHWQYRHGETPLVGETVKLWGGRRPDNRRRAA